MPTTACPSCARVGRFPEDFAGKKVKCPQCGTTFKVDVLTFSPKKVADGRPNLSWEDMVDEELEGRSLGAKVEEALAKRAQEQRPQSPTPEQKPVPSLPLHRGVPWVVVCLLLVISGAGLAYLWQGKSRAEQLAANRAGQLAAEQRAHAEQLAAERRAHAKARAEAKKALDLERKKERELWTRWEAEVRLSETREKDATKHRLAKLEEELKKLKKGAKVRAESARVEEERRAKEKEEEDQRANRLTKSRLAKERYDKWVDSATTGTTVFSIARGKALMEAVYNAHVGGTLSKETMKDTLLKLLPRGRSRIGDVIIDRRYDLPEVLRYARYMATDLLGDYIKPGETATVREAWEAFEKFTKIPRGEPGQSRTFRFRVSSPNVVDVASGRTQFAAGRIVKARYPRATFVECEGEVE